MAEQRHDASSGDRDYEETVNPKNPPNSVLRPRARRAYLSGSLGLVIALFVIAAAVWMYWASTDRRRATPDESNAREQQSEVGTTGDAAREDATPGGINPDPRPESTREEFKFRGAGDSPQGPMPPLGSTDVLTDFRKVAEDPQDVIGRRVDFADVEVASVDGQIFWVRDRDARLPVVWPNAASLRPGQRVHVTGAVDAYGKDVRIRAASVEPR